MGFVYLYEGCSLVCIWEELSGNVEDTPEFLAWCGSQFVDLHLDCCKTKLASFPKASPGTLPTAPSLLIKMCASERAES